MGDRTGIEWTDATWNPVTGCDEVSPGCDHCYARSVAERFGAPAFPQGFAVTLRPNKLYQPLRWRRPRRIFVNSMSDLFHASIPDDYIATVFAVMAATPRHTFQVLTKRHARMRSLLRSGDFWQTVNRAYVTLPDDWPSIAGYAIPLPNVWLGVSVESQQWADIRIPVLLDTPAAFRFLSAEPLLGPVDLTRWVNGGVGTVAPADLDWVIVGGESGREARPMHPGWARELRDLCNAAGIAFLFKQWGEWLPVADPQRGDVWRLGDPRHEPRGWQPGDGGAVPGRWDPYGDVVMRRVGKKAAGRELDGRTWDEYPDVAPVPTT